MILTKTPLRVSLVGGGSDLPAYCNHKTGAVVSFAIKRFMYIAINKREFCPPTIRLGYSRTENVERPEQLQHDIARAALIASDTRSGIEINSISEVPAGSVLGSSSAYAVGLIEALNAYNGMRDKKSVIFQDVPRDACTIEIDKCGKPIGRQDQYASYHGGVNYMEFKGKEVDVKPILLNKDRIERINRHMLFFRFPRTVSANTVLADQMERIQGNLKHELLDKMVDLAKEMRIALSSSGMQHIGRLINRNWQLKKQLSPYIANTHDGALYGKAMALGAYGGKLCGAGSGGFLMIFAPPEKQQAIVDAANPLFPHLFKIEPQGTRIVYMPGLTHE